MRSNKLFDELHSLWSAPSTQALYSLCRPKVSNSFANTVPNLYFQFLFLRNHVPVSPLLEPRRIVALTFGPQWQFELEMRLRVWVRHSNLPFILCLPSRSSAFLCFAYLCGLVTNTQCQCSSHDSVQMCWWLLLETLERSVLITFYEHSIVVYHDHCRPPNSQLGLEPYYVYGGSPYGTQLFPSSLVKRFHMTVVMAIIKNSCMSCPYFGKPTLNLIRLVKKSDAVIDHVRHTHNILNQR